MRSCFPDADIQVVVVWDGAVERSVQGVSEIQGPLRRRLSRRLLWAARDPGLRPDMTVADLVRELGDRSFGWCIIIFSLINMLPMPIGSTMFLSIPLVIVTVQMAAGLPVVHLPGFVTRRQISRKRFQRLVLRLRPLFRPVERIVRPRRPGMFSPGAERLLGAFLILVAVALFMPIPLSAYLPAAALLVTGIGLVERDGVVVLAGAGLGIVAIAVTVGAAAAIFLGAESLAKVVAVFP